MPALIVQFPGPAQDNDPPILRDPQEDAIRALQDLSDEVRWLLREIDFLQVEWPIGVGLQIDDLSRRVGAR